MDEMNLLLREKMEAHRSANKRHGLGPDAIVHCCDMGHDPQLSIEGSCRGVPWVCLRCGMTLVVASRTDIGAERPAFQMGWTLEAIDANRVEPCLSEVLEARHDCATEVLGIWRRVLRQSDGFPVLDALALVIENPESFTDPELSRARDLVREWLRGVIGDLRDARQDLQDVERQLGEEQRQDPTITP